MRFRGDGSMIGGAGSTAAGQPAVPRIAGGGTATSPQQAQLLVPDGKNGSWEGYRATGVGAWEWYMASGLLCLDQPSMALLGVDPDTYDGRIETWISHVHPDDIAWVTAEVDKAISTRG